MLKVADIMTKKVITVQPSTPLIEAVELLTKYDFDGMPVVEKDNKLVGILTQYNLVLKSSGLHIPTLTKITKTIKIINEEKNLLKKHFKKIAKICVGDVMNHEPLTINPEMTVEEVAKIFAEHHAVNPVPVVDKENQLLGIVSRYDIIRLYAKKHFNNLLEASAFSGKPSKKISDIKISALFKSIGSKFVLVTKTRTRFWFLFASSLFIVGFIVAFLFIIRVQITSEPPLPENLIIPEGQGAILEISPTAGSYKVGSKFITEIILNPNGNLITSALITLKLDLGALRITDVQINKNAFPFVFEKFIDLENSSLVIGLNNVDGIKEKTSIAKINFQAIRPGKVNLNFDFISPRSNDDNTNINILETSLDDILDKVGSAEYEISY